MKVAAAVYACLECHPANSEKDTVTTYRFVLSRFREEFEKWRVDRITSEVIFSFLACLTEGRNKAPSTPGARSFELSSTTSFTGLSSLLKTPVTVE